MGQPKRRASTGQKDCWCARDKKQAFPLTTQEVRSTGSPEGGHTSHSDRKELSSRLLGKDNPDKVKATEGMVRVWRILPLVSRQS